MNGDDVMKILEKELASKLDMETEMQWDSLDQVTVLQALDEALEGKVDTLPEQELAIATTPKKIIDVLKKHKIIE